MPMVSALLWSTLALSGVATLALLLAAVIA